MAYTIYPEYRPPVTGPRVRKLWAKAFGTNGVLEGFSLQSISTVGNTLTITLGPGTFISSGCVVSCLEDTSLQVQDSDRFSFYVSAFYYEPDNTVDVVISKYPKDKWVVIGRYLSDLWIPSGPVSTYDLSLDLEAHVSNSDIHITQNMKDAFSASVGPSKYNYYLTETDIHIGTVFSPADMQCLVASKSFNNQSEIISCGKDNNMAAFSFSEGYDKTIDNSVERCNGMVTDGNMAYFDIDYSELIIETVENSNTFNLAVSEIKDMAFDKLTKFTVMADGSRASITFNNINLSEFTIPGIFINVDTEVETIIISSYGPSGLISKKQYDSFVPGDIKMYHSQNRPQDALYIRSFSVEIIANKNSQIAISSCCQIPNVVVQHLSSLDVPNIKNFRVSPLAGSPSEGVICHIGTDTRDEFWLPSFANRNHPDTQTANEYKRYADIGLVPEKVMTNKVAMTPWPDNRAGYCTTDTKDTGAIFIIGGYDISMQMSNSLIAYSKISDSYRVIALIDSILANKSSSCSFGNEIIVTGGDGGLGNLASIVDLETKSVKILSNMPFPRKNHGCIKLDQSKMLLWGGIDFPAPVVYNKNTDTWTTINSFTDYNEKIYAKKCEGSIRVNTSGNINNNSMAIYGTGEDISSGGAKFDLATMTERTINGAGLISNSNICPTGGGYVVFQHKDVGSEASGAYSESKDVCFSIENVPITGRGNAGTLLHRDGTISYGPWEFGGMFHDEHNQYSLHGDSWIIGAALKWETSW